MRKAFGIFELMGQATLNWDLRTGGCGLIPKDGKRKKLEGKHRKC